MVDPAKLEEPAHAAAVADINTYYMQGDSKQHGLLARAQQKAQAVGALGAVLVRHAGVPHPNDYGIELSVSCHAETSQGKQLNLERTARVRHNQTQQAA
jgi:hypothetical protein